MERIKVNELDVEIKKRWHRPVEEFSRIVGERKKMMNASFKYRADELKILDKTNQHILNLGRKMYEQAQILNELRQQLDEENRSDGFTSISIEGCIGFNCSLESVMSEDSDSVLDYLSATLYHWNERCFSEYPTLTDFLYRSPSFFKMDSLGIDATRLPEFDSWCYGMHELLFCSDFSIQDVTEKLLFYCEVGFKTDKVILGCSN